MEEQISNLMHAVDELAGHLHKLAGWEHWYYDEDVNLPAEFDICEVELQHD